MSGSCRVARWWRRRSSCRVCKPLGLWGVCSGPGRVAPASVPRALAVAAPPTCRGAFEQPSRGVTCRARSTRLCVSPLLACMARAALRQARVPAARPVDAPGAGWQGAQGARHAGGPRQRLPVRTTDGGGSLAGGVVGVWRQGWLHSARHAGRSRQQLPVNGRFDLSSRAAALAIAVI